MEVGGAWCPNRHTAVLPTRATARYRDWFREPGATAGNSRTKESTAIEALPGLEDEIVLGRLFVNTWEPRDDACSATNAIDSAELNRRWTRKSIPLSSLWPKTWKLFQNSDNPQRLETA